MDPAEVQISSKAGEAVANRIERSIIEHGFDAQHRLGSVGDLMSHYGVGKAALREGIRLLEQRGTVSMRPGPGGGLFVAGMSETAVAQLLATHLQFIRTSADEIEESWELLDALTIRLVEGRLTGDIRTALQNNVRRLQYESDPLALIAIDDEIRAGLADATGNSAIHLMVRSLGAIYRRLLSETTTRSEERVSACEGLRQARAAAVDALCKMDRDTAIAHVRECRNFRFAIVDQPVADSAPMIGTDPLQALFIDWVRDKLTRNAALAEAPKRAEMAALAIAQGISHFGLSAGTALGSASTLGIGIGLSDAVFRETVRLLEHHGVIVSVAGRNGGLQVGTPNPARVLDAAVAYLRHLGVGVVDYGEVREALNIGAAQLAARRVTGSDRRELLRLAARIPPTDFTAFWTELDHFQQILSRCAHNRVLALLHALATRLIGHVALVQRFDDTWLQQRFTDVTGRNCLEWLWQSHGRIYKAIANGAQDAVAAAVEEHFAISRRVWVDHLLADHEI